MVNVVIGVHLESKTIYFYTSCVESSADDILLPPALVATITIVDDTHLFLFHQFDISRRNTYSIGNVLKISFNNKVNLQELDLLKCNEKVHTYLVWNFLCNGDPSITQESSCSET